MKSHCNCGETAIRQQGHMSLCVKHYRFQQMRTQSTRRGKTSPSRDELESMIPKNMICQSCNRKMNWLSSEGHATVITIQHDRDGTLRLICRSCNARHASFNGDEFYNRDITKKCCPRCREMLPWSSFTIDKSRRWNDANTYCRKCRTKMHGVWRTKNADRENKKHRAYYHMRKNSGNPIPRTSRRADDMLRAREAKP